MVFRAISYEGEI